MDRMSKSLFLVMAFVAFLGLVWRGKPADGQLPVDGDRRQGDRL
jgi:hypothetical protein